MARIVIGSYLVRFPMGGYLSWGLQWIAGLQRLGHEVFVAEKSGWPRSCYDPTHDEMTDDCSFGTAALRTMLEPLGLQDAWCYVDASGHYHGLSRARIEEAFATADLFIDMGSHGEWLPEAASTGARVLIDGDPGRNQMQAILSGVPIEGYDHYYTVGLNVGRPSCTVPTLGLPWRHVVDPVVTDLFPLAPPPADAPFTTVMSWEPYSAMEFEGRLYGGKAREFEPFIDLPRRTRVPLAIAAQGAIPKDRMRQAGWRLDDPAAVTWTLGHFHRYIAESHGEFTVNKGYYVATWSGFFSDRSAAYLASGRPVVMQDTGFSEFLPTGEGLFAVRTLDEAVHALEEIAGNYTRHVNGARAVAREVLDTSVVLPKFLRELNVV